MSLTRRLIRFLDLDGPENDGRLSFTKALIIVAAVSAAVDAAARGLSWQAVVLWITCFAASFGKKSLDRWLGRITVGIAGSASTSDSTTTTHTVSEHTTRTILERRDPSTGYEKSGKVPVGFQDAE